MDRPARTLGALLVLGLAAACGDGSPGSPCDETVAPVTTPLNVTIGADQFSYNGFSWGANNDCTPAGSSVVSVNISGGQMLPLDATAGLGLCLPRPDRIGDAAIDLADSTLVQLTGLTAIGGGCTTTVATNATPTGTVTFTAFCARTGRSYRVSFGGQVAGTQQCGSAAPTSVTMLLGGAAQVNPQ